MIQKSIQIKLETGLEARPVAMLVQVASQFESTVYINADDRKVNAKSIMGTIALGIIKGKTAVMTAEGNDAEQAVDELAGVLA